MKYFKDTNGVVYLDPIESNHDGLIELTKVEFDALVVAINTPPPLTPLGIRNAALADITYTRPSDGVQIQVRHPDYASDYILMTGAIGKLEPLGTRGWISKDNLPILVTREDLEAAVAHGDSELDNIYTTFIATL